MDNRTWFDPTVGVLLMHPSEITTGMCLAHEAAAPDGSRDTVLRPVWSIGCGGTHEHHGGIRYNFRTMDGELITASSNSRVWAVPEILPENLPPHDGMWITNQKFGMHDHKAGVLGDRYFYQRTRALDTFTDPDGRTYRLLEGRSTRHDNRRDSEGRWHCYWVYRWEQGVKWLGPSREVSDLAYEQFEMIRKGRAW